MSAFVPMGGGGRGDAADRQPPPLATKATLATAIKRGDMTTCRSILLSDSVAFDINSQGMDGGTLLMLAAESGNASVCGLLLQRGADVNTRDTDNCSALWGAASYGHAGVCELLCRYGALVNAPCGLTETPPLLEATFGGHLETCEILLQHGALVNLVGRNNVTPLTLAAEMGHACVCELLLRYGADVNGCGLKLLVSLGNNMDLSHSNSSVLITPTYDANSTSTTSSTNSSNFISTYTGSFVLSTLIRPTDMDVPFDSYGSNLTETSAYFDPTAPAMHFGMVPPLSIDATSTTTSTSTTIPTTTTTSDIYKDGSPPLLLAASNGKLQCCQLLLKYGADVNRMNKRLYSPLHRACVEGHKDICELLIAKGASINTRNYRGCSALAHAATNGHNSICELLLKNKADPNIASGTCANGCTPLMLAVAQRHVDTVKLMLDYKADANRTSSRGDTALMFAASEGYADICQVLIDAHRSRSSSSSSNSSSTNTSRSTSTNTSSDDEVEADVEMLNEFSVSVKVSDSDDDESPTGNAPDVPLGSCNTTNATNTSTSATNTTSTTGGNQTAKLPWELDVDAQNEDGITALMLAAFRGRYDICEMLLEYGASTDITDKGGFSALMLAATSLTSDQLPKSINEININGLFFNPNSTGSSLNGFSMYNNQSVVRFPMVSMSAPASPRYNAPYRDNQEAFGTTSTSSNQSNSGFEGEIAPSNAAATGIVSDAVSFIQSALTHNSNNPSLEGRGASNAHLNINAPSATTTTAAATTATVSASLRTDGVFIKNRTVGELDVQVSICKLLIRHGASVKLRNNDGLDVIQLNRARNIDPFNGFGGCFTFSGPPTASANNSNNPLNTMSVAFELESILIKASRENERIFGMWLASISNPHLFTATTSSATTSSNGSSVLGHTTDADADVTMNSDQQLRAAPPVFMHDNANRKTGRDNNAFTMDPSSQGRAVSSVPSSLPTWPSTKPSSNSAVKRSLYVSTGFNYGGAYRDNHDGGWSDYDSYSDRSMSPRSSTGGGKTTATGRPAVIRRDSSSGHDALNTTAVSDASNTSFLSSEDAPPPPPTCYDSDDARSDPTLSPRSAMRRRLMRSSESSAEAEIMFSALHLAAPNYAVIGNDGRSSPRPFESDSFMADLEHFTALGGANPFAATPGVRTPSIGASHIPIPTFQNIPRPSSPRTAHFRTGRGSSDDWASGSPGGVSFGRSMPTTLVSDVLAFQQQSQLQQLQLQEQLHQQQQQLQQQHHQAQSGSSFLSTNVAVSRNQNAREVIVREPNILHRLPADIARLAISFL